MPLPHKESLGQDSFANFGAAGHWPSTWRDFDNIDSETISKKIQDLSNTSLYCGGGGTEYLADKEKKSRENTREEVNFRRKGVFLAAKSSFAPLGTIRNIDISL